MKNAVLFILGLLLAAGVYFYLTGKEEAREPTAVTLPQATEPEHTTAAPPRYPVTPEPEPPVQPVETTTAETPPPPPLPALDASDPMLAGAIGALLDAERFGGMLMFESFVRHVVVNIDNLAAAKLPIKFRVYTPVPGAFQVRRDPADSENVTLDPANYQRYTRYVELLESLDPAGVVRIYTHYYPLFQEAYVALGYPDRYFNDRVVEVIDVLLATPEVAEPIQLSQPAVLYTYSDPGLEALSSGQKMLLRAGPDNGRRLRELLREYRRRITTSVSNTQVP
ncbi:MAG: DUF3014 domain-containing protein [Gammaproteobacteria bacterium]|nr:MAG: DUF3014 domain-containing protein [Gammaproteobacteria bacterium]